MEWHFNSPLNSNISLRDMKAMRYDILMLFVYRKDLQQVPPNSDHKLYLPSYVYRNVYSHWAELISRTPDSRQLKLGASVCQCKLAEPYLQLDTHLRQPLMSLYLAITLSQKLTQLVNRKHIVCCMPCNFLSVHINLPTRSSLENYISWHCLRLVLSSTNQCAPFLHITSLTAFRIIATLVNNGLTALKKVFLECMLIILSGCIPPSCPRYEYLYRFLSATGLSITARFFFHCIQ